MSDAARHTTRRDAAVAAALFALAAAAFWPAVDYPFVNLDDPDYVTDNPIVRNGLTWPATAWAFTTGHAANWHPLTWLSLEADASLWGTAPAAFHRTNVLLHAANAALLYLALARLAGAPGRAAAAALLFALHPLRVESVAWVAERKDVLCGLFWMLALLAHARHAAAPSRGRAAAVALALALALLAKPMAVTLPCVLLLLDAWPLGRLRAARDLRPLVREKVPLFLLAAASCAATAYAQFEGGAVKDLRTVTAYDRVAGAPVAYEIYLLQTVWPAHLTVHYPLPVPPPPPWQPLAAIGLLSLLAGAAWRLRRPAPYLLVGWLWFLGTLVPVIGLVQVGMQAHADRYTYFPSIGLAVAAVWGAADLAVRHGVPVWARAAAVALVAVSYAGAARAQLEYWRDDASLWEHNRDAAEPSALGYNQLGIAYGDAGRLDGALAVLGSGCRQFPDDANLHVNLALALLAAGRYDEAERVARTLEERFGGMPLPASKAVYVRARAAAHRGQAGESLRLYAESIAVADEWRVRYEWGKQLRASGRPEEAVGQLGKALGRAGDVPEMHYQLGVALADCGDWLQALSHLEGAASAVPDSVEYGGELAVALAATGRVDSARRQGREVARLDPGWPARAAERARRLAADPDPAVRRGPRALWTAAAACAATEPTPPEFIDAYAAAAAECGHFSEAVELGEQAAKGAERAGRGQLADDIRARVALYRARKPFRSSTHAGPP